MSHHCDDGGAGFEIFFVVLFFGHSFRHFGADELCLETEFVGYEFDGLGIEALVDADHDADAHARADDFRHGDVHHGRKFVGCNEFRDFQNFAFGLFFHELFLLLRANLLTFFFAVLCAFRGFRLACQTGQRFFYLFGYVLIGYFRAQALCLAVAFLVRAFACVPVLAVVGPVVAALLTTVFVHAGIVEVDAFLIADAGAFFLAFGGVGGCPVLAAFLFAFLAALFLALLLGTGV